MLLDAEIYERKLNQFLKSNQSVEFRKSTSLQLKNQPTNPLWWRAYVHDLQNAHTELIKKDIERKCESRLYASKTPLSNSRKDLKVIKSKEAGAKEILDFIVNTKKGCQ